MAPIIAMDVGPSLRFQLRRLWMQARNDHQNLDNHAIAQSPPCREFSIDFPAQLTHRVPSYTENGDRLEPFPYHVGNLSVDDRQGPHRYVPNSPVSATDEKPLPDNKAPNALKSSSCPRRKKKLSLMAVGLLQRLFGFGVEFVELPQHENPLQKQVLHIHNDESGIFDWLIIAEALLERIYQRLRFLYYRLAVYTIACFWSYSVFPGRIRPPCTTMPWTIWPALVVLWGVCWMFYPSPDETSRNSQPHLEYQLQPEELDEGFFGLDACGVDPNLLSFGDSSFSDEWLNLGPPSTNHDSHTMPMGHNVDVWPPTSTSMSQPSLATIFDPDRSTPTASSTGLASQHDLVPGHQQNSKRIRIPAANRVKCPECDKILSRHDSLRRHQQTQHNREVEEHLCPHKPCKRSRQGSGFSRPDGLRRHLKACKSRLRRATIVALEPMSSQPNSGSETREESQASSPRQDTCSTQGPNGVGSQQSLADSWEEELRKRYEEAKVVYQRKKSELEEAQRVMDSFETLIKNAKKGHAP